jgi:hypothetical protein
MEVHAHTHTARQKWSHYFWEFFMLFLAVTLGFFVENQREHYIEHKREKVLVQYVAQDLKQDIIHLDSIVRERKKMDSWMDSLLYLVNYDEPQKKGNDIYYYTRRIPRTFRFYSIDRTISQLKNAGTWRLIRKSRVSDQLLTYDNLVRTITVYIEDREESLVLILYESINVLFDNKVFESMINGLSFTRPTDNPQLTSYDKKALNEFCNRVHFRKNANYYFIQVAQELLNEAKKTLQVLHEEYHVE